MARGISLELRCDTCHSNSLFPAGGRGRGYLLGELYVSPNREWMTWSGHYRQVRDADRNQLPGPRQQQATGPGTTWRAVPREGVQHECRPGRHRMVLTEAQLWELVRPLPADATILYLPVAGAARTSGSDIEPTAGVTAREPDERWPRSDRQTFSTNGVKAVASIEAADRRRLQSTRRAE